MATYQEILQQYRAEGRFRRLPEHNSSEPLLDLSGNDYLGLAGRYEEFYEDFISEYGLLPFSSSASRLLARHQEAYFGLEHLLSLIYGREALIFNSGYHANVGVISALNIPGTMFLSDKLIHASAIDGITMRKSNYARWRHNDISDLRNLIEKYYDSAERLIVVAESLYSMDGDMAPLRELAALRREFPKVMLYIDEAHSFGVFGKGGAGLCEAEGILQDVDIIIGTFGKACGSSGAFAAVSPELKDFLVNNARSLIFSTAIPPVCAAWTEFMIQKISEMDKQRAHLASISETFRSGIEQISGSPSISQSQIVPFLTGSAAKAVTLSRHLLNHGILALPIRRPTVPAGTERIRFSLHASLSYEDVSYVIDILNSCHEN